MNKIRLLLLLVNVAIILVEESNAGGLGDPCITPIGDSGTCTRISKCSILVVAIRSNNAELQEFVKKSFCGYDGRVKLACCGPKLPIEPPTTTDTMPTSTRTTPATTTIKLPPIEPSTTTDTMPTSTGTTPSTTTIKPPELTDRYNPVEPPTSTTTKPSTTQGPLMPPPRKPGGAAFDATQLAPLGICGRDGARDRVTHGNITLLDDFPWMALIWYKVMNPSQGDADGWKCAGTIINKRFILTAAHCMSDNNIVPFTARLGEHDYSKDAECRKIDIDYDDEICKQIVDMRVKSILAYPFYTPTTKEHDIGLLLLEKDIEYNDFVKPICLLAEHIRYAPGKTLIVSGWGKTEKTTVSTVKLKGSVPVVSNANCSRMYNDKNLKIKSTHICAGGGENNQDACQGDSGGPLMDVTVDKDYGVITYQVGVVSYGTSDCGLFGVPGIYTRVDQYFQWIKLNIRNTIELERNKTLT